MYTVLIADDEPIERVVLSKMIRKYYEDQIEIVQAVNGREAIALFEENNCQVAILDIEMPGINGLEAAKEIRNRNKECSIIFLTAFDEFAYAKKAISVRALDYLLKPCVDEELTAVLDEAIRLIEEGKKKNPDGKDKKEQVISESSVKIENARISIAQRVILDYIEKHYMEDISLQDAADALHYSDVYFCKLFKQCFDKNFTSYMAEYRIGKAKKLLCNPAISIKEAGEKAGYKDANYFTKVFKRVTDFTPSEYRLKNAGLTIDRQHEED